MFEDSLKIPTWQNGCIEEMVYLKEIKEVLKYTFSNSIDHINTAIYARTGQNINLEEVFWTLNKELSISVKHMMNFHNVNYSMTICERNKKQLIVNMRVGDNWFLTGFDEIKGRFIEWTQIATLEYVRKIIMWNEENK